MNNENEVIEDNISIDKEKTDVLGAKNSSKSSNRDKIIKEIKSYVGIVISAILVAAFVNSFILSNTRIPTGSMENTIMCGNRLFGNRLAYKFADVKRGDIVIFEYPDDTSINYIKRVIGLPGETVNIIDGVVYVDNKVLKEDYLKEPMQGSFGPYEVPEDSYFVMGDNRNNSNDARFWSNTYVHKDSIIAKAVLRYWPSIKKVK